MIEYMGGYCYCCGIDKFNVGCGVLEQIDVGFC